MENMLHLAPSSSQALALDRSSVFSREHVPPAVSAVTSLPVIDMSRSRDEVRRAILDAGMEFGFFLVRCNATIILGTD
jgi:2'-deoxymugineic-acid 2'-dioxygenase / mugineic-acid 3-dioxygenase